MSDCTHVLTLFRVETEGAVYYVSSDSRCLNVSDCPFYASQSGSSLHITVRRIKICQGIV